MQNHDNAIGKTEGFMTVYTGEITDRIKKMRAAKKITQEDMAELLNITHSTYVKMENAFQNITVKHLMKISEILNVSADMLLFGDLGKEHPLDFNEYVMLADFFEDEELEKLISTLENIRKFHKENFI